MATFQKFNSLVEAICEKVHNFGADALMVFLCASANAPVATNTQLSQLTQISYTNCSSRAITTTSSSQTSGTYRLVVQDKVLTATGGTVGPFRYPGIYNDSATNDELVCFYDYGSDITLQDGETFTLDFDSVNGLFSLS